MKRDREFEQYISQEAQNIAGQVYEAIAYNLDLIEQGEIDPASKEEVISEHLEDLDDYLSTYTDPETKERIAAVVRTRINLENF